MRWQRKGEKLGYRPRVFSGSMCDIFEDHPDVVDSRLRLWALIERTPRLIWMLLTKRPENMLRMVPPKWVHEGVPENVWLGVSAGDNETFWSRSPHFIGACDVLKPSVAFISLEPLIGPVDPGDGMEEFDWVIVGGESGPKARPMHQRWAVDIMFLCQDHGIPFFFKQWGAWLPWSPGAWGEDEGLFVAVDNGEVVKFAEMRVGTSYSFMYKVGKARSGSVLMGAEWRESPGT